MGGKWWGGQRYSTRAHSKAIAGQCSWHAMWFPRDVFLASWARVRTHFTKGYRTLQECKLPAKHWVSDLYGRSTVRRPQLHLLVWNFRHLIILIEVWFPANIMLKVRRSLGCCENSMNGDHKVYGIDPDNLAVFRMLFRMTARSYQKPGWGGGGMAERRTERGKTSIGHWHSASVISHVHRKENLRKPCHWNPDNDIHHVMPQALNKNSDKSPLSYSWDWRYFLFCFERITEITDSLFEMDYPSLKGQF